jgi:hypothetical protein
MAEMVYSGSTKAKGLLVLLGEFDELIGPAA